MPLPQRTVYQSFNLNEMLNITVIHVGDFKEDYLKKAYAEYEKRISRFAKLSTVLIKEQPLYDENIENTLAKEGKDILHHLDGAGYKIALCIEGKMLSSEELAKTLENITSGGISNIKIVIGSSHGMSEEVKRACDMRLSMSKMTFPHQLARVMVAEQIYRVLNSLGGGKYHK